MDSSLAQVIAIQHGRVTLSLDRRAMCPRCAQGRGCGAGLMLGSGRIRQIELPFDAELELGPGDQVLLQLPDEDVLRAATFAYGMPLAGLLTVLALTWLIRGPLPDAVAVMAAATGLILGWFGGRQLWRAERCRRQFQAKVAGAREAST